MKKKSKRKLWLYRAGWLRVVTRTNMNCEHCHSQLLYFFKYDSMCCPMCNRWNESICDDAECEYCAIRPETPEIGLFEAEKDAINIKHIFTKKYSDRLKRKNHRELIDKLKNNGDENRY